jgi:hypothetical protein
MPRTKLNTRLALSVFMAVLVEVTMLKSGEEKDKKSATFEVTGY